MTEMGRSIDQIGVDREIESDQWIRASSKLSTGGPEKLPHRATEG